MSTINDSDFRSKIAGEDLSDKQFCFVTLETDGEVDAADAITDVTYGVLQNAPESGKAALIKVSGETKVEAAATLAVNVFVGPSTSATAQVAVATQYARGRVVAAAGSAADLAVIQLFDTAVALT